MATATITSKGQMTLPKELREALGVRPGDKVDFEVRGGEVVMHARTVRSEDAFGAFRHKVKRTVSVDEMDSAIARGACEGNTP